MSLTPEDIAGLATAETAGGYTLMHHIAEAGSAPAIAAFARLVASLPPAEIWKLLTLPRSDGLTPLDAVIERGEPGLLSAFLGRLTAASSTLHAAERRGGGDGGGGSAGLKDSRLIRVLTRPTTKASSFNSQ